MKRILACILSISLLTGICTAAGAEVNTEHRIIPVKSLSGSEYSKYLNGSLYGFEETDKLTVKMGRIADPSDEIKDKISAVKTTDEKYCVYEFSAYDKENDSKTTLSEKTEMQITLSGEGLGSGFSGMMGKDYKVFRISDTAVELPVVESKCNNYSVTFETDELGIFAILYNPNAITLTFVSDFDGENETVYKTYENLNTQSVIEPPEPPVKEGSRFAGWYSRMGGQGIRLYPGITLGELGACVYAYWVSPSGEYSLSDTGFESVVINDTITCTPIENQHIYFISDAKDLTNINALIKPNNPYAYVYCGESVNNMGRMNEYPLSESNNPYQITKTNASDEARLYVKIVSEDLTSEELYSFIFADDTASQINPIGTSEYNSELSFAASGIGSFVPANVYTAPELKAGTIAAPDSSLTELVKDLALHDDTLNFFDLLAFDGDKQADNSVLGHLKVTVTLPASAQAAERFEIYRINENTLTKQNILTSTQNSVTFEADRPGRFALICGANAYNIKFISDGNEYTTFRMKAGDTITAPEKPIKNGYTFDGWYTEESGAGEKLADDAVVSGDALYYANWKKKAPSGGSLGTPKYIVTFNTNGGSSVAKRTVEQGMTVQKPDSPQKDGYVFAGWYADKELTQEFDFTTKISKTTTIYAKWEKADENTESKNQIILTVGKTTTTVFGETKQNDVAPIVRNDRAFLPARFVAENLGATVKWNGDSKTVTIKKGDIEIIITIGDENAVVNGTTVKLDYPAFIENDRTFTPIRFISERLGADVDWNQTDSSIVITRK